jgi:hypothetical protein
MHFEVWKGCKKRCLRFWLPSSVNLKLGG